VGGVAGQTSTTVPVTVLADGRYVAHALYIAPQSFVSTEADKALAMRSVRVRATWVDSSSTEHVISPRTLSLFRVPVLYVHGMWGNSDTFQWPVTTDPRWITRRADYSDTNDVSFDENVGMPPRVIAELRKEINDLGIAGTRFFVVAYSMGAVLFKIYMSQTGAPYARADNFFSGDVYALVPVAAPLYGSYFATFARQVQALPLIGPTFSDVMRKIDMPVDRGCIESLDAESTDTLEIPLTIGTFHAFIGWGGGEMRAAGIALADRSRLADLKSVLEVLDLEFESFILRCASGDDFIVCTDSQQGGLPGSNVSDFHFAGPSAKAIHFDSMCEEQAPSAAAAQLLNTPTTDLSVWGMVLPQAPPAALRAVEPAIPAAPLDEAPRATGSDGILMTLAKQGDGLTLAWTGTATRLLKSYDPGLVAGACLAVSGTTATDPHALTVPAGMFYALGGDALCLPQTWLTVAAVSPPAGSAMGGFPITVLGSGFTALSKVKVGDFYARQVAIVDSTTLTCVMPPGHVGHASITVIDPSGQAAVANFQFTDPGDVAGTVEIIAPVSGTVFAAGSTITVTATGVGGFKIAKALVSGRGFASDDDQDAGDGFSTVITLPPDTIGPVAIEALARDASGNLKAAAPVSVMAIVPGNVGLLRLDAERVTMLDATPTRQLRVYGIFSDGILRELTHAPGVTYEMDTQDIRKPNYPYNGTGVAVIDASGLVTAKTQGETICHIGYAGLAVDVVIEVAGIRPSVTVQKPGFISWPYQGPGVTYDLIRGNVSALRATRGAFSDPTIGLTCLKNNFTNVTAADASNPTSGEGFFYVMRESRTGSYDESPFWPSRSQLAPRTQEINAASGSCP
jgi:pimeloyl-ACP methyl ester carboxylesterase